jgi:hypothetical protein
MKIDAFIKKRHCAPVLSCRPRRLWGRNLKSLKISRRPVSAGLLDMRDFDFLRRHQDEAVKICAHAIKKAPSAQMICGREHNFMETIFDALVKSQFFLFS